MKRFKIMDDIKNPCKVKSVPLDVAKKFEDQAQKNHLQSIERLNERGGVCAVEFYCLAKGIDCLDNKRPSANECIKWIEDNFLEDF